MSFSGLYRKIGGRSRNRLRKAINELISDGLLKQKSQGPGKEVQISLAPSELLNHLNGLNKELSLIQTMIKRTFNALKDHKYLFKFPVQVGKAVPVPGHPGWTMGGNQVTWKINPKAKREVQLLTNCLNSLFQHSGALTYTESLELLPKSYNKKVREYQKECIKLIKTTVSDLFNLFPKERAVIQMHLDFNVRGLNTIRAVGQMATRKISLPKISRT